MSNGPPRRKRIPRTVSVQLPPGRWKQAWTQLRSGNVWARVGLCLLAAVTILIGTAGWQPPFRFRTGQVPQRDIVARTNFAVPDLNKTQLARDRARQQSRYVYEQDAEPLVQLRSKLINTIVEIGNAPTLEALDPELWQDFQPPLAEGTMPPTREEEEEQFEQFRAAVGGMERVGFEKAIEDIFAPLELRGLLQKLQHSDGDQKEIIVHPQGQSDRRTKVQVADVLIDLQTAEDSALKQQLLTNQHTKAVGDRVFTWLRGRLPSTLIIDQVQTARERDAAVAMVPPEFFEIQAGQPLAFAGKPLGPDQMELLRQEQEAYLEQEYQGVSRFTRSIAVLGLIGTLFALCAGYVYSRKPRLSLPLDRFALLLALAALSAISARWLATDAWRAEIIAVLLFSMAVAIAMGREIALPLTVAMTSFVAVVTGKDVGQFLILLAVAATAIMLLGSIRSRLRLIQICLEAGLLAAVLAIGVAVLDGQPLSLRLLQDAGLFGFWTLAAGFVITGVLPLIERGFGVLTDLSLYELGDASHPLLQQLVQRAPGTYNHSINVASLAEGAAESIGARGLLVRVGAYFHDIGKMLKPGYFTENQQQGVNRHDTLMPAMSTLIIVAHVKDGVELALNHHLPQPIIDFIEQHHGTTLVEYFYHQANERSQTDPDGGQVEENAFRYPGPKPQTKEAAVLMLADAVESACRSLSEPTPARIESVVESLAMKRLLDGQFDESSLTLKELRSVQNSLTKTLIAVYHGRVKYPDQRTA